MTAIGFGLGRIYDWSPERRRTFLLRLGAALSPALELAFADVARDRGSLAWCAELAGRVRALARELTGAGSSPLRTA